MSNFVVGLTGGIGSGKTTVANMFSGLGVALIDADIVAREVVSPGSYALEEIKQRFGNEYVSITGDLERAKLRHKVFGSEVDKLWLNNLLHPLIRHSIVKQLASNKDDYCILVAPLLIENNLVGNVNRTLVIDVNEVTQIKRTLQRDGTNTKTIESIIASQLPRKDRLKAADDVIDNTNTNIEDIEQKVYTLHQSYLTLSQLER